MWNIIGVLLAIAVFAIISLNTDQSTSLAVRAAALKNTEISAANQMSQFASAAYSYAAANSSPLYTNITPAQVIAGGYLPSNFSTTNGFGQPLIATVAGNPAVSGKPAMIVYYQSQPQNLYGLPVLYQNKIAESMEISIVLADIQQGSSSYSTGTYEPGPLSTSGATLPPGVVFPYTVNSSVSLLPYDPTFSLGFVSPVDLINIIPHSS